MKQTKIIAVFTACGRRYYEENHPKDISVLNMKAFGYRWVRRKRTEEELAKELQDWESTPHLLSGEGYVNQIRNELIDVMNPDYPKNYINDVVANIGKYDYIFLNTNLSVFKELVERNIEFLIVYPHKKLKAEWLGRLYMRDTKDTICKAMNMSWNLSINELTGFLYEHPDIQYYELESGQYLSDAIAAIQKNELMVKPENDRVMNPYGFTIQSSRFSQYSEWLVFAENADNAEKLIQKEIDKLVSDEKHGWTWGEPELVKIKNVKEMQNANLLWQ